MERIEINISELIKDQAFIDLVERSLNELLISRKTRSQCKPGFRYKRDWYDRMSGEGVLNCDYFIKNIADIWMKKSSLNSECRSIIKYVCDKALAQILSKIPKETV